MSWWIIKLKYIIKKFKLNKKAKNKRLKTYNKN